MLPYDIADTGTRIVDITRLKTGLDSGTVESFFYHTNVLLQKCRIEDQWSMLERCA